MNRLVLFIQHSTDGKFILTVDPDWDVVDRTSPRVKIYVCDDEAAILAHVEELLPTLRNRG